MSVQTAVAHPVLLCREIMLCDRAVTLAFEAIAKRSVHDGRWRWGTLRLQPSKKPLEEKSG
jgi:hypothetical protein